MGEGGSRLGQALDPRRNALNALRLVFAIMVIVSHAWPIGGFGGDPALAGFSLGGFGVAGFFAISGYLISESRARKHVAPYAVARALRILPGLWVALLATAFVAAPLAAVSKGGWSIGEAIKYVLGNVTTHHGHPSIGGTLAGQPTQDWNGSLWTLFYEALCYVAIGVIFLIADARRRPQLWMAAAFAGAFALGVANRAHVFDGHTALYQGSSLVAYFFAGSLLWAYRDQVPLAPLYAVGAAILALVFVLTKSGGAFVALPLAYVVLWLGQGLPAWTHRINNPNDISYGMYIYAFPVTQLLVIAGVAKAGAGVLAITAIAATVPLAVASWFLVERPAKSLSRLLVTGRRPSAPELIVPAVDRETQSDAMAGEFAE